MQKREPLLKRILKKLKLAKKKPLPSEKPYLPAVNQYLADSRLMRAAGRGDISEVRRLLKKGANVDANIVKPDHNYMTPLMNAAMYGHTKTCALLLENGANIDAIDDVGRTALMLAAWYSRLETCKLLIERGASMATKKGINMFTYTQIGNKEEKAEFLSRLIIERMAGKEAAAAFVSAFKACLAQ